MNPASDIEGQQKEVSIEELPNELLVLIFSHLSPEDLACHVSKVCSRWLSIAKDHVLWATAALVYDESHTLQFQRTILFAPFLAKLDISMFKYMNNDTIQSILSGCNAVRCLSFYPNPAMSVNVELRILNHYQSCLEELNMYIDDSCLLYVLNILSNMAELKCLTFRGCISSQFVKHDIFCHGWKSLESLEISDLTVEYETETLNLSVPNPWQNFILQMLDFKAHTLKKLSLPECVIDLSTVEVFERKFASSIIENLKICEMCLGAVKNLNSLKTLHVKGISSKYSNLLRTHCQLSGLEYSLLFDWVNATPQFLRVKDLTLENIFDDERNLTSNILKACKNIESFTFFSACFTSAQLASVLSQLPLLKFLSIHRTPCLKSRHLDLITSYQPNLKVLNLRYNTLTDGILQYYRDHVQAKMPNLKLICDWGYWTDKGGQPWNIQYHSRSVDLFPKSVMNESSSSSSHNLPFDRAKMRMVLDSVNDYEDDD